MDNIVRPKFITVTGRVQSDGSVSVDLSYATQHKSKTLEQVTEEQSVILSKGTGREVLVYELVRVLKAERVVTPMDVEYERKTSVNEETHNAPKLKNIEI